MALKAINQSRLDRNLGLLQISFRNVAHDRSLGFMLTYVSSNQRVCVWAKMRDPVRPGFMLHPG
jgi:hypothetical protein